MIFKNSIIGSMLLMTIVSCTKGSATSVGVEIEGSYSDACTAIESGGSKSTFDLQGDKLVLGTLQYPNRADCSGAALVNVVETLEIKEVVKTGENYEIKTSLFPIHLKKTNNQLMVIDNESGEIQNTLNRN